MRFQSFDLSNLSVVQLRRLYCRVWDYVSRASGTGSWDWPTLCICHPGAASVIRSINAHLLRAFHN